MNIPLEDIKRGLQNNIAQLRYRNVDSLADMIEANVQLLLKHIEHIEAQNANCEAISDIVDSLIYHLEHGGMYCINDAQRILSLQYVHDKLKFIHALFDEVTK